MVQPGVLAGKQEGSLQAWNGIRKQNLTSGTTTGRARSAHHPNPMKPFGITSIKITNHDERILLLLLPFLYKGVTR